MSKDNQSEFDIMMYWMDPTAPKDIYLLKPPVNWKKVLRRLVSDCQNRCGRRKTTGIGRVAWLALLHINGWDSKSIQAVIRDQSYVTGFPFGNLKDTCSHCKKGENCQPITWRLRLCRECLIEKEDDNELYVLVQDAVGLEFRDKCIHSCPKCSVERFSTQKTLSCQCVCGYPYKCVLHDSFHFPLTCNMFETLQQLSTGEINFMYCEEFPSAFFLQYMTHLQMMYELFDRSIFSTKYYASLAFMFDFMAYVSVFVDKIIHDKKKALEIHMFVDSVQEVFTAQVCLGDWEKFEGTLYAKTKEIFDTILPWTDKTVRQYPSLEWMKTYPRPTFTTHQRGIFGDVEGYMAKEVKNLNQFLGFGLHTGPVKNAEPLRKFTEEDGVALRKSLARLELAKKKDPIFRDEPKETGLQVGFGPPNIAGKPKKGPKSSVDEELMKKSWRSMDIEEEPTLDKDWQSHWPKWMGKTFDNLTNPPKQEEEEVIVLDDEEGDSIDEEDRQKKKSPKRDWNEDEWL